MTGQVSISVQIGSTFDGSQALLWSLRRNENVLAAHNVIVPRPKFYRRRLTELAETNQGAPAPKELQDELLYSTFEPDESGHVFFTDIDMMEPVAQMWDGTRWFPDLGRKAAWLHGLLPSAPMRFLLSMRHPASFLSDVLRSGGYPKFDKSMPDPTNLSWRDVVGDLRTQCPDVPMTVWRAEDLPLVWGQAMHAACALPDTVALQGIFDPLEGVMSEDGLKRLRKYLADRTDFTMEMRERVIAIFIDKFAAKDALANELDIPGWTEKMQKLAEEKYLADVDAVAGMAGVTYLGV